MGDVTDKVKFENWLLYGLNRPESWLTHVKALHLDCKKAEAELARVTAEAAVMREVASVLTDIQWQLQHSRQDLSPIAQFTNDIDEACEALSSTSAGAGLLKRLEASEAVCEAAEVYLTCPRDAYVDLIHKLESWRSAKGETK